MSPRKRKAKISYVAALAPFLTDYAPKRPSGPPPTVDRCLRAHVATTLAPDDKGPLSKAFRELNLNPDDPLQWRVLVELLALKCFGGRGRGRPKQADKEILDWEMIIRTAVAEGRQRYRLPPKELTNKQVAAGIRLFKQKLRLHPSSRRRIENQLSAAHKRLKAHGPIP